MLNRIGIGIEIDPQYCELAKKRILSAPELMQQILPLGETDGR
jgi:site-specific DNA-methyltransferase (adenine-specific)